MRRAGFFLAVAAASALLIPAPASATRTREVKTHFDTQSISTTTTAGRVTNISGNLKSKNARCLPDRLIEATTSPDDFETVFAFATGTTDQGGHFSLNGDGPVTTKYRLTVQDAQVSRLLCLGDAVSGGPFAGTWTEEPAED
jgi:hypothetical protein